MFTQLVLFEGGTPNMIESIMGKMSETLNLWGPAVTDMLVKAVSTFAPIVATMSIVWLAINLFQHFTSRAGR